MGVGLVGLERGNGLLTTEAGSAGLDRVGLWAVGRTGSARSVVGRAVSCFATAKFRRAGNGQCHGRDECLRGSSTLRDLQAPRLPSPGRLRLAPGAVTSDPISWSVLRCSSPRVAARREGGRSFRSDIFLWEFEVETLKVVLSLLYCYWTKQSCCSETVPGRGRAFTRANMERSPRSISQERGTVADEEVQLMHLEKCFP